MKKGSRVVINLLPHNDLEPIANRDGSWWQACGDDPHFLCNPVDGSVPSGGWYIVKTDFEVEGAPPLSPQMYADYGRGFNEGDRVLMPGLGQSEFSRFGVIRFTHNVRTLRFDPSSASLTFSLSRMTLVRTGRARAAYRMIRGILTRKPTLTSRFKWLRNCFVDLTRNGVKQWADQLVRQYEGDVSGTSNDSDRYSEWVTRYDSHPDRPRCEQEDIKFSVLLPVYNTPEKWLRKCLDSVINQSYRNWELCVVDDASTNRDVAEILSQYAGMDERIKVRHRESNGHISAASNDALDMATGEFAVLIDHDDEIPEWTLDTVARTISENPEYRLIYSDEDKIDESGKRYDPYFKPDWNYELLLAQNFISHLGVYKLDLVREVGGFRIGLEGSQDWDLALRCIEKLRPSQIGHISRILYHWRSIAGSTALAVGEKDYVGVAGLRAVKDHLVRIGANADAVPAGPGRVRVIRQLTEAPPKVSLIIPTRDKVDLLKICISSIIERTDYPDFEIIIVDNQSALPETHAYFENIIKSANVSVLRYDAPFNYSAINNFAAKFATGEIIGLLNNDIEVEGSSWLREMVSEVVRPDVGAVGAMLLYPDGKIQHAGVILGMHGIAGHMYAGKPRTYPGQMGRAMSVQELSAVTAACLIVRREVFNEVEGFDTGLAVAFNDIDFCLRIRKNGYRNIWTPHAVLIHHESASRGYEDTPEKKARFNREVQFMRNRWGDVLTNDPAYNRNLCLAEEAFRPSFQPRRTCN